MVVEADVVYYHTSVLLVAKVKCARMNIYAYDGGTIYFISIIVISTNFRIESSSVRSVVMICNNFCYFYNAYTTLLLRYS